MNVRSLAAAIAVPLLTIASGIAPALAQAAPAANPPPPPSRPGWVVDVSPYYVTNAGSASRGTAADPLTSGTRLDFFIARTIGRRFTLGYRQFNVDLSPERFLVGPRATPVYPAPSHDLVSVSTLTYALRPDVDIDAGYYRRWRVCCPGAGDRGNAVPIYWDAPLIQVRGRFGPRSRAGRLFSAYVGAEEGHRTESAAALASYTPAQRAAIEPNDKLILRMGALAQFTIPKSRGVTPYFGWDLLPQYFSNTSNTLHPAYANQTTFGVRNVLNRYVTFEVGEQILTNHLDGSGPSTGQVLHFANTFVRFTLHDTFGH